MKVAILGAGHIAQKMARTLGQMSKDYCYAVASRDLAKAQAFAEEWGFKKAYGSYEEMVADPEVDLVYVATPHSHHHRHVRLALENGRNVLCEKAFMVNAAEAEDVINLAREQGLLLAEAAWPRYTPFSLQIKKMLDEGIIGKPYSLSASLGYPVSHVERIIRPELGGGALLDLGVYPIHFARLCFGDDITDIQSTAVMSDTGVDLQESITFTYSDGRMACLHATALACNDRQGIVNGEKGCLIVDNINNPLTACIYSRDHAKLAEYHAPEQITGFEYQVLACQEAIENGWVETKALPHAESLRVMQLVDQIRGLWK